MAVTISILYRTNTRYAGCMPNTLRPISLSVEEPKPGDFFWVLFERHKTDRWSEIQRADNAADTFQKALAEGVKVWQEIMNMGNIPISAPENEASKQTDPPARKKPSLFGFGPAR